MQTLLSLFLPAMLLMDAILAQGLIDPRTRYANLTLQLPVASGIPVLETSFRDPPDHGETTYVGSGRLQGRKALITGGDSGIGRAVAIAFVREGAQVAINYLPGEESDAQTLVEFLRLENSTIIRLPGDLRNESFCTDLIQQANSRLSGLDILVSNAAYNGYLSGPNHAATVANLTTAEFDQILHTNVYPSFFLARAATPLMPPGSSIIYTGTSAINAPDPALLPYASSKAFIDYWARTLARQLFSLGIRVSQVLPPLVYSAFLAAGGYTEQELVEMQEMLPTRRLAQPAELASAYVELADAQSTLSGGNAWDVLGA